MSLLEMVGTILTELEKVQEKLDKLLASGTLKERTDILKTAKDVEKEIGINKDVIEALLPEAMPKKDYYMPEVKG